MKKIVIIGASSHGKVVADIAKLNQYLLRKTHTYTVEKFEMKFVKVVESEEGLNTGEC